MPSIRNVNGVQSATWLGGTQTDEYRKEDGVWKLWYTGYDAATYAKAWAGGEHTHHPFSCNPAPTGCQPLHNSSYLYFSDDCTNFLSQSLRYGGWIDQLVSSGGPWWYHDNQTQSTVDDFYSGSWSGVNELLRYMLLSGRAYQVSFKKSLPSASNVKTGDVMFLDFDRDGTYDHAVLISQVEYGGLGTQVTNIRITAHTNDVWDRRFWDSTSEGKGWENEMAQTPAGFPRAKIIVMHPNLQY
jgi:hypothetical protein